MKKILIITVLVNISLFAAAQPGGGGQGGFQRPSLQERVVQMHKIIDSAFSPSAETIRAVDSVFIIYYSGQDKMWEDMRNGGSRDDMRTKMEKLTADRDAALKPILGDKNFDTFKKEIEPKMMQGRGGRGPGGPGGGRPGGK